MLKSRYASRVRIRRGFAAHEHGALHFRWAGKGPPLLALHESPRSSLSLIPLIEGLAGTRTVIAFDTPGYGHSEDLPHELPAGGDYAGAFLGAMSSLGIERAAIYATHTGAALATHMALARPDRVASLLLDGFAAFTPAESAEFLSDYLASLDPAWDGSHLARLWSRCKDLYLWFPYNRREAATRLAFDPPPVSFVHDSVRGFLMAGSGYARGYRCAAQIDPGAAIAALRVPTIVTARPHDLIRHHLGRVTPTEFVSVQPLGNEEKDWLELVERASSREATPLEPSLTRRARIAGSWERVLVELGSGELHGLDRGSGDEADLHLPDIPDTALRVSKTLAASSRRTLVIDPPGCGASDPPGNGAGRMIETAVQAISAALDALGVKRLRAHGTGFGAVLAACLAQRDARVEQVLGSKLRGWALGAGRVPDHAVIPVPERDPDGASLLTSWYRLRELELYDDAGAAEPRQRTALREAPDAALVQARHSALWIAPESALLAAALQDYVRENPNWYRQVRRTP